MKTLMKTLALFMMIGMMPLAARADNNGLTNKIAKDASFIRVPIETGQYIEFSQIGLKDQLFVHLPGRKDPDVLSNVKYMKDGNDIGIFGVYTSLGQNHTWIFEFCGTDEKKLRGLKFTVIQGENEDESIFVSPNIEFYPYPEEGSDEQTGPYYDTDEPMKYLDIWVKANIEKYKE